MTVPDRVPPGTPTVVLLHGFADTEVEGSHVIMTSQPQAVADVVLQALAALDVGAADRAAASV
jgi:hypothetical protein